ncbi:MAG: MATE family efflux transporter [Pseudomonadota bacterium]
MNVTQNRTAEPAVGGVRRWWRLWKQAVRGETEDFTVGPIGTAVFLLSVPMVLEMALESVFAVTDIFFVAKLGADAVTAVGLTEAAITLLYAVAIGLSMGTTAMVARRVGEKRHEEASVVAGQALWMGLITSVVVAVLGISFADDILRLMGASEQVVATGSGYTVWLMGGSLTITWLFIINAVFRGAGDAGIAMRSLWLANGINIVLDPLLIFGVGPFPELGVAGAAVATTIGRGCGVVYQLWMLTGIRRKVRLGWHHLKLQMPVLRRLLTVSAGGVGQFIIGTTSWIFLARLIADHGSAAVAGYTIGLRIIIFTIMPAWGLSNAAATLVGQNLGAGQPLRAQQSAWLCVRYNVTFMLVVATAFLLFAPQLVGIFTQDPAVLGYGVQCLRILSMGYCFYGLGMVLTQALNGAGDTRTPTVLNFFAFWLLQIPLAWWLANALALGPQGVFMAVPISEAFLSVGAVWAFRRGRWKLKEV